MKELLPEKLLKLTPYEPMLQRYKIQLDANESFVKIPEDILNEITSQIKNFEFNRYPDPLASELCRTYAELYNLNPDNVTAGNGSDELISIIMCNFLKKGDKIMTLSPDFSMYGFYADLSEIQNYVYYKDENFNVDIDEVIFKAKTENVKLIIFSNPCNPTGAGIKRNDIIKLIENTEAIIIIDEAYMDFWNQSVLDLVGKYDNIIILKTCSKALAMAALRCGFAISGKKMTEQLRKAKSPYNVNGMTQSIAKTVLKRKEIAEFSLKMILESRDMLYNELKNVEKDFGDKIKVYPTCTNFVTVRTKFANAVFDYLIEHNVCIRKICVNILRITAGTEEENAEFVKCFRDALSSI